MDSSESTLESDEIRRRLYELMREESDFRTKATRALELGKTYLEVENGHLTYINPSVNYWQTIESTDSPDGKFPPGLTLDLETTYCRRTIQEASTIALHDAPAQGWDDDPAFEAHDLSCYHGVPVTVANELYGTVCFVSETPRQQPFTTEESMFAELLGHLLGRAIEQQLHDAALAERQQVVTVLNRVLRHNLRNELSVIQGHADLIQHRSGETSHSIQTIHEKIDDLLQVSDSARKLHVLTTSSSYRQELDLNAVLRRLVSDLSEAHPAATISLDEQADIQIHASPHLEMALRELIENAVKHTDDNPSVDICLSDASHCLEVEISDTGPGLPAQEQAVLQGGEETPLDHGSGMGLWLVYWVVQRHEGTIETTTSDTGTTISVTIPYTPTELHVDAV